MVIKAKSFGGTDNKGETLSEHTIRGFLVCQILLQNLPLDKDLKTKLNKDLPLALAIHDVGKAAIGFQNSLQINGKRWGHRHEILSAAFATKLHLAEEIIFSVITHHKILPTMGLEFDVKSTLPKLEIPWKDDEPPIWKNLKEEWDQNLNAFSDEWYKIVKFLNRSELLTDELSLEALSMDKAWLRRNKQAKRIPFEKRYYTSILRGLLITSDHIASNPKINIQEIPLNIPILKDYDVLSNRIPYDFQRNCADHIGNLILRSPTGSGKTEAALLWAQKNQGRNGRLYYILPNIASINAMYLRLRNLFWDSVGLLHSRTASAIYSLRENDEYISNLDNQRYALMVNSLTREMWFPIRVCTLSSNTEVFFTRKGVGTYVK